MGITGLWDQISGAGELVSLAQLSTDCLKQQGRPYHIAVDEAAWRFHNLTPAQVAAIQKNEPRARPVEKAIFHRIVSLLQLNIQLLFVFDGPKRPQKRGRKGGATKWTVTQETRDLLTQLSVPQHMAPGEAEAECARLQQEGVVDAVWTDDGDAFMFGTTTLIKTHREKSGAKSQSHVRLFRAEDIKKQFGLDQDGFVLFALLAGGDYATEGLARCGPKTAVQLAKQGLGQDLCNHQNSTVDMQRWRAQLRAALKGKCDVPSTFPKMRALKYYTTPTVSSAEQLCSLRALQKGWDVPLDEFKLRVFLRTHYNIQTKSYLKHIVPILLLRTLCATTPGLERANNMYGIELARTRKRKGEDTSQVVLERKITFLPQAVTSLDLSCAPAGSNGEDWTPLASKDGSPFDATARTDCEMLEYALQRGVPHVSQNAVSDAAKPAACEKRKSDADEDEDAALQNPARKRNSSVEKEDLETSEPSRGRAKRTRTSDVPLGDGPSSSKNVHPVAAKDRPAFRMPPSWTDIIEPQDTDAHERRQYFTDIDFQHPSVEQSVRLSGERRAPNETEMALMDRISAVLDESKRRISQRIDAIEARELAKRRGKSRKATASVSKGQSVEDAIILD